MIACWSGDQQEVYILNFKEWVCPAPNIEVKQQAIKEATKASRD